ncbi:MAG: hypothetical protein AAF943_01710 [Pseudomonadota bacterium]
MGRTFEGARLDVAALAGSMPPGGDLAINTIRKSDLKRLNGLQTLPLSTLSLRWLSAVDLTRIPLPPSLKTLRIWHSGKLVSLAGIEAAERLQTVSLRGNGALEDAMPLRALAHLKDLSIQGEPTSLQKISTLDFLEGLALHRLSLRAVEGTHLDLGSVARLKRLEEIDLHGPNFSPAELAKVAAARPHFLKQLMHLPTSTLPRSACPTCGGARKELFIRSQKGLWCPSCEAAALDRELNRFLKLVTASRVTSAPRWVVG